MELGEDGGIKDNFKERECEYMNRICTDRKKVQCQNYNIRNLLSYGSHNSWGVLVAERMSAS